MQVRATTFRRGNKTYQYAQLVESYRRKSDGVPLHRVIANLGRITDPLQLENLKAAFAANRSGQRLAPVVAMTAEPTTETARLRRPQAILRYLDVAVVVEMMRTLGLTEEIARLLPKEESEVAPDRIITALVAQRCLDPQSKLHAVRWFPRTALPELLGVSPAQFNNTRVHRVLDQLETAEHELMRALSRRAYEQHGRFATMYLDLTDTWFEGEGPLLAKKGKTKEGLVRKKIGIVLLCDDQGHPLRWEVVQGTSGEGSQMLQMMRTVQQVPWLEQTPIVCDRALGSTAYIRELLEADVQFITSLVKLEFDSYGVKLPSRVLADLPSPRLHEQIAKCTAQAAERARQTELVELSDDLFYTDLGLVEIPVNETQPKDAPLLCSEALRIGLSLLESVACRKFSTHAAAARSLGLSTEKGHQHRILTRLDADLQEHVLAGHVDGHTVNRLFKVASLQDKAEQRAAFAELMRQAPDPTDRLLSVACHASHRRAKPSEPKRVRVVAYFNPHIFARQRWLAQNTVVEIEAQVLKLNQRLANPHSHLKPKGALHVIEDRLRRHDLLNVFEVKTETVTAESGSFPQIRLTRNEAQWQRRRSFDGFSVLVAHPKIKRSAAQLTRTYRAKNAVEADFHIIKSLVKLRPVRHRTDTKVRAHVALCMLALHVQRELTARLKKKEGISAEQALEQLEPCRLSLYAGKGVNGDAYVLPEIGREQLALLRRLGLTRLVEQRQLGAALRPRSEFVPTESDETA
jgi:transposase